MSAFFSIAIPILCLLSYNVVTDGKVVQGLLSSRQARLQSGQYIAKFCFDGGNSLFKFSLNQTADGTLYFFIDEKWPEALATPRCQDKLALAKYSYHLDTLTGEQKFSQWVDPYMWHLVYADDVTCDSSAALRGDTLFSLELYNTDSQGEPRNHFGYDERGVLALYELLNFIYFAAAVMFGQRLWHTIQKGGPMHLVIKLLSLATLCQAVGHFLVLIHLFRYSGDGEGQPWLYAVSRLFTTAAEFEMLSLMARLSMGWTLSSSYNSLDPKILNQLNIVIGVVSIIEFLIEIWNNVLLLVLVKLVIAGAFCLNVSRKISEERSALRRDFYNKFVKGCLVWILSYPVLALVTLLLSVYHRYKVICWGVLTAQTVSILLLYKLFLSRSLYWEVSSLSASTLPLRLDKDYGSTNYRSEKRTVTIHKTTAVN